MNIKLSGYLAYWHSFLRYQLDRLTFELSSKMTVITTFSPHTYIFFQRYKLSGISIKSWEGQFVHISIFTKPTAQQ
jgi:hypothetical protein